jgi:hypothetical protein
MLSDRDIWLAAKAMIQRYGSNAGWTMPSTAMRPRKTQTPRAYLRDPSWRL